MPFRPIIISPGLAEYEEAKARVRACLQSGGQEKALNLSGLRLTSLPPEISQLKELEELYLVDNQLTDFPSEILELSSLWRLNLSENYLSSLPPQIHKLKALRVLDLTQNHLASLPSEIGGLTELQELSLVGNQFKILQSVIGKLVALKRLLLSDNALECLPLEIGQLTALEILFISNNLIEDLPLEIGQLGMLRELRLGGNRLSGIPSEIGQLSALEVLHLHNNELILLPTEIGRLIRLRDLGLGTNRLVKVPTEICGFNALERLFLDRNEIESLPSEIGQLSALKLLDLHHNKLTSLPSEIGRLGALTELNLEDNQLTGLPREMGQLSALKGLYLNGNARLELPHELLLVQEWEDAGQEKRKAKPASPKAILDYYFNRQTQGTRPLNEVKLLLLGRGEAGKTSVSRALRGVSFQKEQAETPGIEIRPWGLECPGAEPVKVHVWDFAGQEITHETHRFFLTERSLYLVVLDGRGGQQMEEAEYWLGHVERYGSHKEGGKMEYSPVIVVLNKWHSPGPYEVEKRRLQREHPNIRAFVETDCKKGLGIDKLRETICAVLQQMQAVRQEWPLTYFRVRQRLENLTTSDEAGKRRHFLTWEAYRKVCAECGVTNQDAQTSLAENLNALGLMLYYGDDRRLRDTRVLNPNWVANGLYGLVRGVHRRPFRNKPGLLLQGDFPAVLAEGMKGMNAERGATIDDYPVERDGVRVHEFLLEMMLDRELGFLAGEDQNLPLYLLPALLTLDEPEPKDYDVAVHIEQAQLRFRYLYELLPAGVMSRFIVRTHPLSDDFFRWQRGVVLGWGDARALVMAERRRNPRVNVYIKGGTSEERQELAGVVRANMEEIHRGLPDGLRGREELDLTVPGEQYESVEKLEKLEAQNMPVQVMTPQGAQNLPVTPELEQVQPAKARKRGAPKLKVFVSYSHANYKVWDKLKPHLDVLINENLISWWFDGKIRAGSEWDDAIRQEMKEADIIILLLSTPFFASKYIKGVELNEARRRFEAGEAEILPVLLEPSEAFAQHKWLNKLQTVPNQYGQLRPISSYNPSINGWNEVQRALRVMIAEVAARRGDREDNRGL